MTHRSEFRLQHLEELVERSLVLGANIFDWKALAEAYLQLRRGPHVLMEKLSSHGFEPVYHPADPELADDHPEIVLGPDLSVHVMPGEVGWLYMVDAAGVAAGWFNTPDKVLGYIMQHYKPNG